MSEKTAKPLLLGMNNPLSDDPEYDLYPYPEGSSGWRLWKMLPGDPPRAEYLRRFDRRNLLRAREWSAGAARAAAAALLLELRGRTVIVLGSQVRAALDLPRVEPLTWHACEAHGFDWLAVPHPSGKNLWYNNLANRSQVGAFLWSLACRGAAQ